jgi:ABC-type nitrate/sulfonate/bicarbonate transport system substrate-binding protein
MTNVVLFFITILIAFLTASESRAQTKVKIGFTAMTPRMAPMWVAQDQRFFTKYGIDAETVFVRSSPTALAAMMAGEIQIGGAGGTAVLGAAIGGTDLKLLATFTNRVTYDLVARPEIKSPQDLRGKRVGVQAIGGTVWMGAILGLEHLGLEPVRDKINILVVGDQAILAQALAAGTIDATVLDGSFSLRLQEKGFSILAQFSKVDIPFASLGLVARKEYIDKNPTVIEGALRAVLEGSACALSPKYKASTLATLQRRLKIGDREAELAYNDMLVGLDRKPYPSLAGLRNIQRLMKRLNPKVEKIEVGELVEDRFLRTLDRSGFIDKVLGSYGVW